MWRILAFLRRRPVKLNDVLLICVRCKISGVWYKWVGWFFRIVCVAGNVNE